MNYEILLKEDFNNNKLRKLLMIPAAWMDLTHDLSIMDESQMHYTHWKQ